MKQTCQSQGATTLMASCHRCTFAVPLTLLLAINACDVVLADGPAQADPLVLSDHDARVDRPPMERRPSGIAASCSETYVFGGYGWEDGQADIMDYFVPFGSCFGEPWAGENVSAANLGWPDVPAHTGKRALQITEEPHCNSTPRVVIAYVEHLEHGDTITAGFWGYDESPDGAPFIRIWADYANSGNVTSFRGSAGGNVNGTSGIGWEELTHTWEFDAGEMDPPRTAIKIQVRVFSDPPDCAECSTDFFIDDVWVEVCSANPAARITFPDGSVISGPGTDPYTCYNHCGGQAPSGCWCDQWCCDLGDCCADQADVCSECDPTVSDDSCFGRCGEQAPGGCSCHPECVSAGNCCEDACESCGIPAGCAGRSCPGDFNGDHTVNISDLLLLFDLWGTCENDDSCFADLNGDGIVNLSDLLILFDQWGDCPPLSCPAHLALPLGPDGTLTWPDWTDELDITLPFAVNPSHFGGELIIEQVPAPGTVFSGVQTVDVTIMVSGSESGYASCSLNVDLIDVTPPVIEILGIDPDMQYIAPNCPMPIIAAHDTAGPVQKVFALLNGEPYAPGTQITEPGFYLVRAAAIDAFGNIAEAAQLFECREYPLHQPVLVVHDMTCEQNDGYLGLSATILLGAASFDTYDLNLWSVQLWLLNEQGVPLHDAWIPIAGSIGPDGQYDHTSVQAVYVNGVWVMNFEIELSGDEAPLECPAAIRVTGTGNRGHDDEFDIVAFSDDLVSNDDPFTTMCDDACPECCNTDGELPPPPEPECPCKWKQLIAPVKNGTASKPASGSTLTCSWSASAEVSSSGGTIEGDGTSTSSCYKETTGSRATAFGYAVLHMWLEGPEHCCKPRIDINADPTFTTSVSRAKSGRANAGGDVTVHGSGVYASAKGGTSISSSGGVVGTVWGSLLGGLYGPHLYIINFDTSVTQTSLTKTYTASDESSEKRRSVRVDVTGVATIGVQAWYNTLHGSGTTTATITGASPGVEIFGICQSGPCAGESSRLRYR